MDEYNEINRWLLKFISEMYLKTVYVAIPEAMHIICDTEGP
jgi:hypothetical protein